MFIKSIIKKIIYGEKASSGDFIRFLRKKGLTIGSNTVIFEPKSVLIDITRPSLISIGDNVKITRGVTILTHGYDWSVLRIKYGEILGSAGKVLIGDNVFIGVNTTILKNTSIGNNVIIGANSLVRGNIPSDVVIGGNPAKVIMTLDEYYSKRKKKYLNEAKEYALSIYETYGRRPKVEDFHEFFPLFLERSEKFIEKYNFKHQIDDDGGLDYNTMLHKYIASQKIFGTFEEFLNWCGL